MFSMSAVTDHLFEDHPEKAEAGIVAEDSVADARALAVPGAVTACVPAEVNAAVTKPPVTIDRYSTFSIRALLATEEEYRT
jgi:hypothetical protein